jgi:hypothetical protein
MASSNMTLEYLDLSYNQITSQGILSYYLIIILSCYHVILLSYLIILLSYNQITSQGILSYRVYFRIRIVYSI